MYLSYTRHWLMANNPCTRTRSMCVRTGGEYVQEPLLLVRIYHSSRPENSMPGCTPGGIHCMVGARLFGTA